MLTVIFDTKHGPTSVTAGKLKVDVTNRINEMRGQRSGLVFTRDEGGHGNAGTAEDVSFDDYAKALMSSVNNVVDLRPIQQANRARAGIVRPA